MSDKPPVPRRVLPIAVGALLLVAAVVAFIALRGRRPATPPPAPVAAAGPANQVDLPPPGPPVTMDVPEQPAGVAAVLEVLDPAAVRAFLATNPWLRDALAAPLGRGFFGSWAGFLGTRGEDLGNAFQGTLRGLALDRLFSGPLRLAWFSGAADTPALLVPEADRAAQAAFAALDRVARRGTFTAARCPGQAAAAEAKPRFEIARWLVAEHAVFAAADGARLAFARSPAAALAGLCADLAPARREDGVAFEVDVRFDALGREAQSLAHLLGVEKSARLQFGIEGEAIVPRGIAARLAERARLARGALPADLLRLVPEDTGVVLAARPVLPATLDAQALQRLADGTAEKGGVGRTVALLWNPRGDGRLDTEVALVWGGDDRVFLETTFGPKNRLFWKTLCGHEVLATSLEYLARIESACSKRTPSLAEAPPAVVKGLGSPFSLLLAVHSGRVLSRLALEAWQAEQTRGGAAAAPPPPPPELDEAVRGLLELPFFGLFGAADGARLVPGGFRS